MRSRPPACNIWPNRWLRAKLGKNAGTGATESTANLAEAKTLATRSERLMCPSDNGDTPIVESTSQSDGPDLTRRALQQRIRQQEILAKLGVTALQGASFDKLLADTARLTAEGLRTEFCKVLEHIPSENRFLVRAGVGWSPGIVGVASVGADLASPAGFALRNGQACDFKSFSKMKNDSERRKFFNSTGSTVQ